MEAGIGDPQLGTDHPWYAGELSCSTFERLFATQARLFERVTGRAPQSDEDRALAAWMWRNLHYAHGEEGAENLWGTGFRQGDTTTREYWTGLFAHGFGLCGTTHAQWSVELQQLLGHGRSRTVGVVGHNACEVFLKGGDYGSGRWALLDHDVSTVVFDPQGKRLLSIAEIGQDLQRLGNPTYEPSRQHGWPLGGLHPDDPQAYAEFNVVEHLPGYAGPPPMIELRRGETLRRYFEPGLDDGRTFVYWGRNYRAGGIPGPERSRTWVNQPEKFFNSKTGSGFKIGQARYGNAVYTYRPNFADGSYKEAVLQADARSVVFGFQTPFIIAATPPDDSDWGIYEPGCRNGLTVRSLTPLPIEVSVDRGTTWHQGVAISTNPSLIDFTDIAKGSRQYWLRVQTPAAELTDSNLEIVTICQANPAIFPRLQDGTTQINYASSGLGLISAGPTVPQVQPHIIEGELNTPRVTLQLAPPADRTAVQLFAAAHVASSNPPDPEISYQIEYSLDGGRRWEKLVADWRIIRQGEEPAGFWSQSFCYGWCELPQPTSNPVQVRFRNNGGKRYLRAEVHLAYPIPQPDFCKVTYAWETAGNEQRTASRVFAPGDDQPWQLTTGTGVRTRWVELEPVVPGR